MNKERKEKLARQSDLQWRIQRDAKVNIVNCGSCGSVLLHEINEEDIECPFCGFESEPGDFPDYFYDGFEGSGEFYND